MNRHPLIAVAVLLIIALPLAADELSTRLKHQAEELQKQAAALEAAGNRGEAAARQAQAAALLKQAAEHEAAVVIAERTRRVGGILERQMLELRTRYSDLRARGQLEQAERVRQEMNTLLDRAAEKRQTEAAAMRLQVEQLRAGGADDPRARKIEQQLDDQSREITRLRGLLDREPDAAELAAVGLSRRQRRSHLLEAAAHLRAAGRAELADDLTAEATELARAEAIETPRPAEPAASPAEAELRKEIEALRKEVQELRARLNRP